MASEAPRSVWAKGIQRRGGRDPRAPEAEWERGGRPRQERALAAGGPGCRVGVRLRVAREPGAPRERVKTLVWGLQWPPGCEEGIWHSPTWNKDEAWGLV